MLPKGPAAGQLSALARHVVEQASWRYALVVWLSKGLTRASQYQTQMRTGRFLLLTGTHNMESTHKRMQGKLLKHRPGTGGLYYRRALIPSTPNKFQPRLSRFPPHDRRESPSPTLRGTGRESFIVAEKRLSREQKASQELIWGSRSWPSWGRIHAVFSLFAQGLSSGTCPLASDASACRVPRDGSKFGIPEQNCSESRLKRRLSRLQSSSGWLW